MRTRLSSHALLAVALLFSAVAGATTIIPAADPGELALDSQAVFLARAGASTVERRSGYVSTVTSLEVLSVVKGNMESGDRVEVVAPGGEKNGSGWAVAGSPRLAEGEVYLFFADRSRDGQWQPRLLADSVLQRAAGKNGSAILVPVPESTQIERMSGFGPNAALVPAPVDEKQFLDALAHRIQGEPGWE